MDEIRAVEERIQAAFAAGDAEAIAAEYTEDALLMIPDQPAVAGRAAIAAMYRAFFEDFTSELSTIAEEAEAAGEWAFLRGRVRQAIHPRAGGAPLVWEGKYLAILRRGADGRWRFARDIFNSDHPVVVPDAAEPAVL